MVKEVDFNKGVRGTHHGRIRIIGAIEGQVQLQPTTADTGIIDLSNSKKPQKKKDPKKLAR